jgi:hypothetical protein
MHESPLPVLAAIDHAVAVSHHDATHINANLHTTSLDATHQYRVPEGFAYQQDGPANARSPGRTFGAWRSL